VVVEIIFRVSMRWNVTTHERKVCNRLKLAGSSTFLLFETNLPKPFVLLTYAFMFLLLLLLLNKSLTKKQTSILPYSAKIFILPFSC
jgi:hypothetical protein